jgi:hypothetical protein
MILLRRFKIVTFDVNYTFYEKTCSFIAVSTGFDRLPDWIMRPEKLVLKK